jgi:urease accessory protein
MNNNNLAANGSQWHAFLTLGFILTPRGVALNRCEHKGPLYVQKPFYPEGRNRAHVYLLHPPGGLVSGDRLDINSHQQDSTQVLITTPGAGRVYKARPDKSLQHQCVNLHLGKHCQLEWLPQETLLYPDAQTRLETNVHLSNDAQFIGWELTCFGLSASHLPFGDGQVNQTFTLYRNQKIAIRERLLVHDKNRDILEAKAGLKGFTVNGFMVAGPFSADALTQATPPEPNALIETLRRVSNQVETNAITGISFVNDFLVIRYLGADSAQGKHFMTLCWQHIRPHLFKVPMCQPRIWAT